MKIRLHFIFLLLFLSTIHRVLAAEDHSLSIQRLRCEMLNNPQGIDVTSPRFSWNLVSTNRATMQSAYQVMVASTIEMLNKGNPDVWNSGKVNSNQAHLVRYGGPLLKTGTPYCWKVIVWDNHGLTTVSEPATFSMGLLRATGWKAKWIGIDKAFPWDSVSFYARLSARYLRKEFTSNKQVKRATVYTSGLGLYELYINGNKIGDQVLAPSPTDYDKNVKYNTYDVTQQIKQGENVIATVLGNGRYFPMRQNYKPHKWHQFGFPKLLLQMKIDYTDGSSKTIISDETWKLTTDGPIRSNNEYDGEDYDATKEMPGWNKVGFNDAKWLNALVVKAPGGKLEAQMNEPMKVMETVKPVAIKPLESNKYMLDMGQNMVGWLKIRVQGKRGDTVTLRFAESLQPDGSLYTANLRDAKVTDHYILNGNGIETWHPIFVFHGFRYVEVSGYRNLPTLADFAGEVVYDALETTGRFETSNKTINQVFTNAYWGIRGNYKGMPIDCPQRNERQPWLGDRATGAYGESFIFDNAKLYAKWLDDIEASQTAAGSIPDVAPSFWYYYKDDVTWPGTYLTIADMLYRQFGDKQPVIDHYASMKKWLLYMKGKYLTAGYIMPKDSYGDWCVPPESLELIHAKDSSRLTEPTLLATAYYYYLLQLLEKFAVLSDHKTDTAFYQQEAVKVKTAFNKKFYNAANHSYSNNTVTANILPLAFNLVPGNNDKKVFNHIVDKILNENNGHISTGVIGTQWLMRWLSIYGRQDIAYKLASNTSYPSWGYMVENGATTIWELWNGNTANPQMNSQNHVMLLGDLIVWFYENLAGIKSDARLAGFKKIIMKPEMIKDLDHVNASYQSVHGLIKSDWKKSGSNFSWKITVPANTTAQVYLPGNNILENGKSPDNVQGITYKGASEGKTIYTIGSGDYEFSSILKPGQ